MQPYTQYIASKRMTIEPESDDYVTKLINMTDQFRTFDEALDEFLLKHGFTGEINNVDQKVAFIEEQYQKAGIPKPRNIRSWYDRHIRPDGTRRRVQIQLCFAFQLTAEEANAFFRKVCLERDFDCHSISELVYWFSLKNGLSYREAGEIIKQIPDPKTVRLTDVQDVVYTQQIRSRVEQISDADELIQYIEDHIDAFAYNNASGSRRICELWNEIAGAGGLCEKERDILYHPDDILTERDLYEAGWNLREARKERRADATSTFGVLLQILGLSDMYTSRWGKDRSLKPFLTDNRAIHPIAERVFPDRDGIEKVLHGVHVSYERIRKILILLLYYKFWIEQALEHARAGSEFPYEDTAENEHRFLAYMNDELTDVGLQTLYEGNPYDWIFIFASSARVDEDVFSPLDNLRGYMKQLISIKELET